MDITEWHKPKETPAYVSGWRLAMCECLAGLVIVKYGIVVEWLDEMVTLYFTGNTLSKGGIGPCPLALGYDSSVSNLLRHYTVAWQTNG